MFGLVEGPPNMSTMRLPYERGPLCVLIDKCACFLLVKCKCLLIDADNNPNR